MKIILKTVFYISLSNRIHSVTFEHCVQKISEKKQFTGTHKTLSVFAIAITDHK